jgi:hypothetical protein
MFRRFLERSVPGFLAVFVGMSLGCDSPSPLAPSPGPETSQQASQGTLGGAVSDTAFRPLAGATVDIVDGPQSGASTTSDEAGRFSFTGTFDGTTRIRATKEGYVAATRAIGSSCAGCTQFIYFYLAVRDPTVSLAGDYTLTFIADSACVDIPNEVRTRTYAATITATSNPSLPANSSFDVTLSDPPFLQHYDTFTIAVAGDYLAGYVGHDEPYLVEQVAPHTYLGFSGLAEASANTSAASTISASFDGVIDYCELKSEPGSSYRCTPDLAVARARCAAKNHQLILRRR